jgi:hypothetical protein
MLPGWCGLAGRSYVYYDQMHNAAPGPVRTRRRIVRRNTRLFNIDTSFIRASVHRINAPVNQIYYSNARQYLLNKYILMICVHTYQQKR